MITNRSSYTRTLENAHSTQPERPRPTEPGERHGRGWHQPGVMGKEGERERRPHYFEDALSGESRGGPRPRGIPVGGETYPRPSAGRRGGAARACSPAGTVGVCGPSPPPAAPPGRRRRRSGCGGRGKMAAAAAAAAAAEQVCEPRRGGAGGAGALGLCWCGGGWAGRRGPGSAGRGGARREELSAALMLAEAGAARLRRRSEPGPRPGPAVPRPGGGGAVAVLRGRRRPWQPGAHARTCHTQWPA